MNAQELKHLETKLWEAADQLRANSKLTATEYSFPVLGLIFLRHAHHRFKKALINIEASCLCIHSAASGLLIKMTSKTKSRSSCLRKHDGNFWPNCPMVLMLVYKVCGWNLVFPEQLRLNTHDFAVDLIH